MPKIIENLESRLMEEARKQIEESGYDAVTIRSVAKGCGVGIGTVYNYFPSKDDLLAAFMLADWKVCLAAINETGENAADGDENAPIAAVFQRRQDQTQYRCRQHDTCGEGQDNVREFVGEIFKNKADQGAEHRCAADTQGC